MGDTFYKPLTPALRNDINRSINDNISELRTCRRNAFTNAKLIGYEALRNIIRALPDGYPLPVERIRK